MAKISYTFKLGKTNSLEINGGVQNILNHYQNDFDQGTFRDAGYMYFALLLRAYCVRRLEVFAVAFFKFVVCFSRPLSVFQVMVLFFQNVFFEIVH